MSENPPSKMPPPPPTETEEDESDGAQSPTAPEIPVPEDEPTNSSEVKETGASVQLDSSEVNPASGTACGLPQGVGEQRTSDQGGAEAGRLPPLEGSPPPVEVNINERIGSSREVVNELNSLIRRLDHTHQPEGSVVVFQMYVQEPDLPLYSRPETRRRHNAGRQTEQEVATEPASENRKVPKPILNQARAVVGYSGPSPPRSPDAPPPRSISSASTIPIAEAYVDTSPFFFLDVDNSVGASRGSTPEERAPSAGGSSRGLSEFDSSSSGKEEETSDVSDNPADAQPQRSNPDATQAVDIPSRPESELPQSSSFPEISRPMVACRRFSAEFYKCVLPKIYREGRSSLKSGAYSEMACPLSREPSVELVEYMSTDEDEETDAARSVVSPQPTPDLILPPEEPAEYAPEENEESKNSGNVNEGDK